MQNIESLDYLQYLLRELQKIDSKIWAGQTAQAYVHSQSIIANLEKNKKLLDDSEYLLRQLNKLLAKLWVGQDPQAWRHNKSLLAYVEREKDELLELMKEEGEG